MALLFNNSAIDDFPRGNVVSFSGADIRATIHRPVYRTQNTTYTGEVHNHQSIAHDLGSIQTLSLSTYRSKKEVRSLGFQHVMGYARGSRTIGGHLVFALIETHPFNDTGSSSNRGGILNNSSGFLHEKETVLLNTEGERIDNAWYQEILDRHGHTQENFYELYKKHQYDFTWDSQKWGDLMHADELPPFDIVVTFVNEGGGTGIMELYGVEIQEEGMTLSIEDLFTEVTYSYTARGVKLFQNGTFAGRASAGREAEQDDWALQQVRGNGTRNLESNYTDRGRGGEEAFLEWYHSVEGQEVANAR